MNTLLVLDLKNILHPLFRAIPPRYAPDGTPTNAVHGLAHVLGRLRHERNPTWWVAVTDAPGPSFRSVVYPEYKAHRPPTDSALTVQLPWAHRVLQAYRIPLLEVPGYEADDVVATVARRAAAAEVLVEVVSSDKDLLQLTVDPGIRLLVRGQLRGPEYAVDRFGVRPDQIRDLLALAGDVADNVPGCPGVGVGTAGAWLRKHEDLEGVFRALNEGQLRGKKANNLFLNHEQVTVSRDLVTLRDDVPLPELSLAACRVGEPDPEYLQALCDRLGLDDLRPAGWEV